MDDPRKIQPAEASQADTEFDTYHAKHAPRMDTSRDIIRGGIVATLRRYFAAGRAAQKQIGTTELED